MKVWNSGTSYGPPKPRPQWAKGCGPQPENNAILLPKELRRALAEFHDRTAFAFDLVTDMAALAAYSEARGWNQLAATFEVHNHPSHSVELVP